MSSFEGGLPVMMASVVWCGVWGAVGGAGQSHVHIWCHRDWHKCCGDQGCLRAENPELLTVIPDVTQCGSPQPVMTATGVTGAARTGELGKNWQNNQQQEQPGTHSEAGR